MSTVYSCQCRVPRVTLNSVRDFCLTFFFITLHSLSVFLSGTAVNGKEGDIHHYNLFTEGLNTLFLSPLLSFIKRQKLLILSEKDFSKRTSSFQRSINVSRQENTEVINRKKKWSSFGITTPWYCMQLVCDYFVPLQRQELYDSKFRNKKLVYNWNN